jgi:hypothetical protein
MDGRRREKDGRWGKLREGMELKIKVNDGRTAICTSVPSDRVPHSVWVRADRKEVPGRKNEGRKDIKEGRDQGTKERY